MIPCVFSRGSLRACAKSLGVRTQKWTNLPDDFYENIELYDWKPYLKDDCYCLYECIQVLRAAIQKLGEELKPTLASTAMALFQSNYIQPTFKISPIGWSNPLENYLRSSYVGGRVEILHNHMAQGVSFDINSSYPFAMLHDVPLEPLHDGRASNIPEFGFAFASVDIPPEDKIPPLHFRYHGKLYFPTGKLKGWYTSAELRFCARRYGTKSVRVNRATNFSHAPIFRHYIEDIYSRRLEAKASGDLAMSVACKYLMNTLSGKFAMAREREKIVTGEKYYDYPWGDKKAEAEYFRHHEIKPTERISVATTYSSQHHIYGIPQFVEHAPYILPHVSSWITADGPFAASIATR